MRKIESYSIVGRLEIMQVGETENIITGIEIINMGYVIKDIPEVLESNRKFGSVDSHFPIHISSL